MHETFYVKHAFKNSFFNWNYLKIDINQHKLTYIYIKMYMDFKLYNIPTTTIKIHIVKRKLHDELKKTQRESW